VREVIDLFPDAFSLRRFVMIAKVFAAFLAVAALTGTSFVAKTDCCSPSSGCCQPAKASCLPACCYDCPDCCDAGCCSPDCCDVCPDCCDICCDSGSCVPAKTAVKADCRAKDAPESCRTEAGK
jgi:hypothetical protein